MKIGVCIRARDEQKIICDWVRYYQNIGFDKIIIYDNMSSPSIKQTLEENNIYNVDISIDNINKSNQSSLYNECINNNKDLDWLLLCDADEFIYIREGNIKEFLNTFSDDTATILINWIVFGTSENSTYDLNKTVFEQFIKRENYTHFWNRFIKSFIRPKLIEKIGNVHITINTNYKTKNVYNDTIDHTMLGQCHYIDKYLSNNTPVVIVHYMTLDFESMLTKQIKNSKHFGWKVEENKYSLEWYNTPPYGFKDNCIDKRMLKYII